MYDDEELLETGSDRGARLGARLHTFAQRPAFRVAGVLAILAALTAAVVVNAVGGDPARHPRAAPASTRSAQPTAGGTAPSAARNAYVDVEYLLDVPAQDMQAAVAACPQSCVASTLIDAALTSSVAQFPGLRPLAGGTVRRRDGRLVLRTVEGVAAADGTDALVHLTIRPARRGDRAVAREVPGDGYRTSTIADVHDDCLLTATLVVRSGEAPLGAAKQWAQQTSLRCR